MPCWLSLAPRLNTYSLTMLCESLNLERKSDTQSVCSWWRPIGGGGRGRWRSCGETMALAFLMLLNRHLISLTLATLALEILRPLFCSVQSKRRGASGTARAQFINLVCLV